MNIDRDTLVESIEENRTLFTVGTGVSIAATNKHPHAQWGGLIEAGLDYCAELEESFKVNWLDGKKENLKRAVEIGDVHEMISIASTVESKLKLKEQSWERWLAHTVGRLRVCSSPELVKALHVLGQGRLATCNYDDILTSEDYEPLVWSEVDEVINVLKGRRKGVVHLHGHWRTGSSVVFGSTSYANVIGDSQAQSLQHAMAGLESLVFVGFGGGLTDPNVGSLIDWFGEVYAERSSPHYVLVKDGDKSGVQDRFRSLNVTVIGYGSEYKDLAPYLEGLARDAGVKKNKLNP